MLNTYQGSCHCQRVRFEVELDLDHVRVCDCSICIMRGGLMHRVPEQALRLFTPLHDLTVYQWGSFTAKDYFCPHCGILPFRRPSRLTNTEIAAGLVPFGGWAINVRCLAGVDLLSIPVRRVSGSAIDWHDGAL